jgi:epoxyqueuosine reductase
MSDTIIFKNTNLVKSTAKDLGFDFFGISKAEFLSEEAHKLKQWLDGNKHGHMSYMENHFDKRLDPTKLVDGAKSVISLLYNYYPESSLPEADNYKIARYAYGTDYHFVVKDKLKEFLSIIKDNIKDVQGRVFVDSAPVLERQWAAKSGLGWIGKNTMLINKHSGSYFFIAEIIINTELAYDNPIGDYCGTCTKCLDTCPTRALTPYKMDASKCISYLTIELNEDIPVDFAGKMNDWIFGCDICQEVCPWNRFSKSHREPSFQPDDNLKTMNKDNWVELTEEVFQSMFRKSALKRTKYKGLKRNITFAGQNT